jgi:hypothetical protein
MAVTAQQQSLRIFLTPIDRHKSKPLGNPHSPSETVPVRCPKQHGCVAPLFSRGDGMTNNTELQRLMRLRRLVREIATSLKADLEREQAFRVQGSVRELLERRQPSSGA